MKKGLLLVLLGLFSLGLSAADMPKQGLGLQIGFARPLLRLNSPNLSLPKDSLALLTSMNGFKVGFVYDASFIKGFGGTMGINYTFAAAKSPWAKSGMYDYPRSRTMVIYQEAEVFVDWQYKFEVAKETYLIVYTGPSIQCGLSFSSRDDVQSLPDGEITSTKTNRYTTDDENTALTRLNVTWGVGAGFQYKRYFLRGGYDFGLINPYKNDQFVNPITGTSIDRNTRGRLDQWSIKIGIYLLYN